MHFYFWLSILVISTSAQPAPTHCYDFSRQSGDIPDSCGSGADLAKQGSDVCDDSGCKMSSGDGYTVPVPSNIGQVFTMVLWVWGSENFFNYYYTFNVKMGSLKTGLRNAISSLQMFYETTWTAITIGPSWNLNRWTAIYVFSTGTVVGFGAYVPNFQGTSKFFEKQVASYFSHTQYIDSSQYELSVGIDPFLSHKPKLYKRFEFYIGHAFSEHSSPFTMRDILASKFFFPLGVDCPNLFIAPSYACSQTWIHYFFSKQHMSQDQQTIYDLSGNNYHALNGNSDSVDSSDLILSENGFEFGSGGHLSIPSILEEHYSYSIEFLLRTKGGTLNTLYSQSSIFYIWEEDGEVTMEISGKTMANSCKVFAFNQPASIGFSVIRESASKTSVSLFVDNVHCLTAVINRAFVPFGGGKLGPAFLGSMSEFRVRKTVIGQESFLNFNKAYFCEGNQIYDNGISDCSACASSEIVNGNVCQCIALNAEGECDLCGNGVRDQTGEECDDGNLQNQDGCDTQCAIEPSFVCEDGSSLTSDICQLKRTLHISSMEIMPQGNSLSIVILLSNQVNFKGFSESHLILAIQNYSIQKFQIQVQQLDQITSQEIKATLTATQSYPDSLTLSATILTSGVISSDDALLHIPATLNETGITLPQTDYVSESMRLALKIFGWLLQAIIGLLILRHFLSNAFNSENESSPVWSLISTNQLIYFVPLMSIRIPPVSLLLLQALAFANGDLLPFVYLYKHTVGDNIKSQESQTEI